MKREASPEVILKYMIMFNIYYFEAQKLANMPATTESFETKHFNCRSIISW